MKRAWERFWFASAGPFGLIAARIIVALTAIWLTLSRPMLPDLARWPNVFWVHVGVADRFRFLMPPLPFGAEVFLYGLLEVALLFVAAGRFVRVSAFVSALLLYHFAPFEDIIASSSGPYFRGFTLLITGLFVISFADSSHADAAPSSEYRWPLALLRLLFSFNYLLSGVSKLQWVGLRWATSANFEGLVLGMLQPDFIPAPALIFVGHPVLCALGGAAGFALDFLFILAVFSRRAARVIVPTTFLAHVAIRMIFGITFLAAPALLLFVNWDWVVQRLRVAPLPTTARSPG
jgi:hypothetical protein